MKSVPIPCIRRHALTRRKNMMLGIACVIAVFPDNTHFLHARKLDGKALRQVYFRRGQLH